MLVNTKAQAAAIEDKFTKESNLEKLNLKCWPVMRYWHPFATEVIDQVNEFQPDKIILLPLYPQYSTVTTGSSVEDWKKACALKKLSVPTTLIGCYPDNNEFCMTIAKLLKQKLNDHKGNIKPRILFSAHGLPQKIVDAGDPYQHHIEKTAAGVIKKLKIKNLDWRVCYQSRVGRLKWIKPYIEDEIKQSGIDKKPIIIVPIAFVSEHSETLVELDIDYKEFADKNGISSYVRVATVGIEADFIDGLSKLINKALLSESEIISNNDILNCSENFKKCICKL